MNNTWFQFRKRLSRVRNDERHYDSKIIKIMNLHLHPYKLQRYINSFPKKKEYADPMCVFLLLETFEVILILFLRIYIHPYFNGNMYV